MICMWQKKGRRTKIGASLEFFDLLERWLDVWRAKGTCILARRTRMVDELFTMSGERVWSLQGEQRSCVSEWGRMLIR